MESRRALGALLILIGIAIMGAGILLAGSGNEGCGAQLCVGPSGDLIVVVSALVSLVFVLAGADLARVKSRTRD